MNTTALPEGYASAQTVDLHKNKKLSLWIHLFALTLAALMLLLAPRSRVLTGFLPSHSPYWWVRILALLGGFALYLVLHVLLHGLCIRRLAKVRPRYGFSGLFAYAGSAEAYFDRRSYLILTLAPVVALGFLLFVGQLVVPWDWFWVFYLIQVSNIASAAWDLYFAWIVLRRPRTLLVQAVGVSITLYLPVRAPEENTTEKPPER